MIARVAAQFRIEIIALLVVGVVALTAGIRQAPLVDWDEATYAEIAHEAVQTRSYIDFTWNGAPYLKKPPLLFWMMIGSFKTFGESEWAARLPSVACGVATMVLLYFFAAPLGGRLGGLLAGLLPLGFYFFVARGGRECATDGPLIFFSALTLFAFSRAMDGRRRWIIIAGLACGLAILSKSLAGFVPLAAAALAILIVPDYASSGLKHLLIMAGLAALVTLPWLLYEVLCNGALFWSVFVKHETLMRMAEHVEAQRLSAADTLRTFGREIRHLWMLLIPLAGLIATALERPRRLQLSEFPPVVLLWILWLAVALGAAAAVQTKLGWYVLPALMPVALLGGSLTGWSLRARDGAARSCPALGALALALLALNMPGHWLKIQHAFDAERDRSRPGYLLGLRARELSASHRAADLYFIGTELPTLVYYSGLHTHFVTSASASGFELLDLGANSVLIEDREVMLVDADGGNSIVGNLGNEWNFSGPPDERRDVVAADSQS